MGKKSIRYGSFLQGQNLAVIDGDRAIVVQMIVDRHTFASDLKARKVPSSLEPSSHVLKENQDEKKQSEWWFIESKSKFIEFSP